MGLTLYLAIEGTVGGLRKDVIDTVKTEFQVGNQMLVRLD